MGTDPKIVDLSRRRDRIAAKTGQTDSPENKRRKAFESGRLISAWVENSLHSGKKEEK